MPWFKIDDTLALHSKVIEAGNAAMGLWVRAGSYCAQQLTDGYVSQRALSMLGTRSQASALVAAGLWDKVPGGWQFHDWTDYQPTRADVEKERAATKERQARWRESRRRNAVTNASRNTVTNGVTNGVTNAAPGDVYPTRPDPTLSPLPLSLHQPDAPAETPAGAGEKRDTPNNHTPARQLAATLLGIDTTDPRLDHLPAVLKANNVRSPAAWLRATALAGDLDALLDSATTGEPDLWDLLPHNVQAPPPGVPMPDTVRDQLNRRRPKTDNPKEG